MRPNTLDEVSLLNGVALTKAEFHARVKTSDWLNRYSEPDVAEEYWRKIYLPMVVTPMQELVDRAKVLGVEIVSGTLAAVTQASVQRRVVVIMAHWKDSVVEFDDLISGVAREVWRERSLRHTSPLAGWLAARLGGKAASSVHDILNQSLTVELPEENQGQQVTQIRESKVSRTGRRREELDAIFAGMLRPGNRLDLLDGMHSKELVEQAVSPEFDGVLDFAACTTTILADYLSHRRRNRLRVVHAPNPLEFVATAPILATALGLLESGSFSYLEARTHARGLWEGVACAT